MRNLFAIMTQKLRAGEDLVLVTVIASSGATPRGVGARMLVGREGRICGTIGGGAVEYRSEHIAAEVLRDKASEERDFSLTKDDVKNLGMICGGAVNIFFRFIPGGDAQTLAVADEAERLFSQGRDIWLISEISDGGRLGLWSSEGGFLGIDAPAWVREALTRHTVRLTRDGRDFYAEQIHSSGRVYVFGCGHVGQELVPVLTHVGFRCVALDDRPEFACRALFPDAEEVMVIDMNDVAKYAPIGPEDYVCVMTRGHAFDTLIQAQVLKTPACYIGVIGSQAKKAGVFETLHAMGFTQADTNRITTPIGLKIGAETPAEIAISIAAQMIAVRARRNAM